MEIDNRTKQLIGYYIGLAVRRRWMILLPFIGFMAIGILLSFILPKVYSASNLILVIPKSVPDKYVPNVLATDVQERINTIRQQIMSRSSIEKLIEELGLFSEPQYKNMYLVDKIETIRKNTAINLSRSNRGIESFTIEYRGSDPEKVMKVVNSLSDFFINESVKIIETEVIETNKFLVDELAGLTRQLIEIEETIKEYRKSHMGELPEELNSNLSILTRLQGQLNEKQSNVRDARNRLVTLQNRLAMEKTAQSGVPSGLGNISINDLLEDEEADQSDTASDKMEKLLNELKTRYTNKHPDIIRLKAVMEAKKAAEASVLSTNDKKEDSEANEPIVETDLMPVASNLAEDGLKMQMEDINRELKVYQEEIAALEQSIQRYQERVENTPKREQELISLRRNYENINRSYANLMDRKLQSDIAVNMERKQKGEKFRVVDTAKLPQKPVSPNMKILFAVCLLMGLASGGGGLFLIDFFDNSLKKPEEIEMLFGVPLLATIPDLQEKKARDWRRLNGMVFVLACLTAIALFLLFAGIVFFNGERLIAIVKERIITSGWL